MLTDMATGTNSFDGFVFAPQWVADFVTAGYLEDLTDRVAADTALQWDDIAPFFRDFSATYNGSIYLIPLDGDFHMIYYRTDLLAEAGFNPPTTLEEYLEIAQYFNGKDLNGDGKPDYGSCISKQRGAQGWQFLWSFIAPYLQTQGTGQGAFFDAETFEPLVKNDGWKKGVEIFKETGKFGPPEELNMDVGATRGLFVTGRCALSIDWGDIGTLAIDPANSTVIDKVGAVVTPGTKQVVDFATGKLVPCDATTCPNAVNGVNYAPYACFGGWSAGINAAADAKKKDATYAFFSYMAQPAQANVDVTIGKTGFNPYRTSQFLNRQAWVEAGMSAAAASDYLGAIEASLASPNMVLDLRIPQNQRYLQVEMDTLLAQYLAGEITIDQFQEQLYDKWQALTEELGQDAQLAAYLGSLGVKK
jgi:multiple sugar transport system substrate-binding protein